MYSLDSMLSCLPYIGAWVEKNCPDLCITPPNSQNVTYRKNTISRCLMEDVEGDATQATRLSAKQYQNSFWSWSIAPYVYYLLNNLALGKFLSSLGARYRTLLFQHSTHLIEQHTLWLTHLFLAPYIHLFWQLRRTGSIGGLKRDKKTPFPSYFLPQNPCPSRTASNLMPSVLFASSDPHISSHSGCPLCQLQEEDWRVLWVMPGIWPGG